jgi:hypothetical protein
MSNSRSVRRTLRDEGAPDDERVMLMRFIALTCGLERICRIRACRSRNRCLGAQLECWSDHGGLLRRRFNLLLREQARRAAEGMKRSEAK